MQAGKSQVPHSPVSGLQEGVQVTVEPSSQSFTKKSQTTPAHKSPPPEPVELELELDDPDEELEELEPPFPSSSPPLNNNIRTTAKIISIPEAKIIKFLDLIKSKKDFFLGLPFGENW